LAGAAAGGAAVAAAAVAPSGLPTEPSSGLPTPLLSRCTGG
jgi:hypothetical protein